MYMLHVFGLVRGQVDHTNGRVILYTFGETVTDNEQVRYREAKDRKSQKRQDDQLLSTTTTHYEMFSST
jgi:hypothetical protein